MQIVREAKVGEGTLQIVVADITTLSVDGIVNAANSRLAGGGGVDGAIHRAAGPGLSEACRRIGSCPTGEARLTPGFALAARYVIHTVGPVWSGGTKDEDRLLASAYRQSLLLAASTGLASLAFPAISTGIYGFPADRAADIAIGVVHDWLSDGQTPGTVIHCCFSEESARLHDAALTERAA